MWLTFHLELWVLHVQSVVCFWGRNLGGYVVLGMKKVVPSSGEVVDRLCEWVIQGQICVRYPNTTRLCLTDRRCRERRCTSHRKAVLIHVRSSVDDTSADLRKPIEHCTEPPSKNKDSQLWSSSHLQTLLKRTAGYRRHADWSRTCDVGASCTNHRSHMTGRRGLVLAIPRPFQRRRKSAGCDWLRAVDMSHGCFSLMLIPYCSSLNASLETKATMKNWHIHKNARYFQTSYLYVDANDVQTVAQ